MRLVAPGTTSLIFKANISSTSNGQALTGLIATSFPTPIILEKEGVSISTLTLSNLASIGASFSAGGIFEYGATGDYRIDGTATGAGTYSLGGPANSTAGQLIAESILVNDSTVAMMPSLVITNNDKTGYALTQTFPANFSAMAINSAGQMILNSTQPAVSFTALSAQAGTLALTSLTVGAGTLTLNGGIISNITGNIIGSLSGSTGTASNVLLLNGSEPGAALLLAVNAQTNGTVTLTKTASTLTLAGNGAITPAAFLNTCTASSLIGVLVYGYVAGQVPLTTLGANAPANWINLTAFDATATSQQFSLISLYNAAKTAATQTSVNAIATVLNGITSLANWLRALARSDTADATAKTEINASGGTYSETASSQQAISVLAGGGSTFTEQQARDAQTLGTLATPAAGSIDAQLATIKTDVLAIENPAGPGGDQCTITIQRTTSHVPIANAGVWLTSDSAGTTTVAGTLYTDSNGHVHFLLNAGDTYYLWMKKDGEQSILGRSFVAVAD